MYISFSEDDCRDFGVFGGYHCYLPLLIVNKEIFQPYLDMLLKNAEGRVALLDLRGVTARNAMEGLELNWKQIKGRPGKEDRVVDNPDSLIILLGQDPLKFGHQRFLKYVGDDTVVYDGVSYPPGDNGSDKCFAIPIGASIFGVIEQKFFDTEFPRTGPLGGCKRIKGMPTNWKP